MRFPAFPRPALLPWFLAAISAVMLVIGLIQGDGVLVTMAVAGIAVGLLAYPAARLLLGPPPDLEPPTDEDDERGSTP